MGLEASRSSLHATQPIDRLIESSCWASVSCGREFRVCWNVSTSEQQRDRDGNSLKKEPYSNTYEIA